ncbi:MAG: hypothetical protein Q4D97_01100 [Eubacteriales bacterium]|nr:hypothetical protein [Eubacteriales bacterium]
MRLTWQIAAEALRFYSLKSDKFVKSSLLLIFGSQLFARVLPLGDRNFFRFIYALESLGRLQPEDILSQLSPGNWLILGLHVASTLLASLLALLYMQVFVLEQSCYSRLQNREAADRDQLEAALQAKGFPTCPGKGQETMTAFAYAWRTFAKSFGRQLLFLLLLDLSYGFSVILLGLPFYFYISAFVLAPIFFMQGRSFSAGLRQSYLETKGFKLFVISNYFLVKLVFLLAEGLVSLIFQQAPYSLGIWESLLFALRFLVFARLAGLMYLLILGPKQEVIVNMTKL